VACAKALADAIHCVTEAYCIVFWFAPISKAQLMLALPALKRSAPNLRLVKQAVLSIPSWSVAACLVLTNLLGYTADASPVVQQGRAPQAPPPAPPIEQASPTQGSGHVRRPLGVTSYSIGQPTDEEQLYLEYLNRMRANPTAEGQRLASTTDPNILSAYASFKVDLNLMQSEFATNPAVPPLAMNAKLLSAARWHSGDMFTNEYQGHSQTNGTIVMSPGDRIATNGYQAQTWGENVYAYADSVFYGHAGFAVDWGNGIGGMQNPAGHRNNMLSASFREVGVGVFDGVNGPVGPQLVTQDLGTQFSAVPFITGVVYYDFNGNGFYDLGEGIGGVTINTPGSSYFTVSANSGGYALPVSSNGTYTLTFTAPGLSNQVTATISNLKNTKTDLVPGYNPPIVSGPNPAVLNQTNNYTFTAVAGATGYQWEQAQLASYTRVEGAENGTANVTIVSSPGYSVVNTDMAASGTHSFNLAHGTAVAQSLTLNPFLLVSAGSQLSFAKYLGFATSSEVAEAQITADNGQTWQTVWSEPGNDGSSSVDSAFSTQTVSLGAYAGQILQIRFVYDFNSGSFFQPSPGVGLYLDDIAISSAQQLIAATTNNVISGQSFAFVPATVTNDLLRVRAQINGRFLPWGAELTIGVTTQASTPVVSLTGRPTVSGNQVQIPFAVANFRSGMTFQLWHTASLQGAWTQDAGATLQILAAGSSYQFNTTSAGAGTAFFRVRAN
jgi:hypothetical protein